MASQRKVGFFYLTLKPRRNSKEVVSTCEYIQKLFSFINAQSKKAKKVNFNKEKFCFIESYENGLTPNTVKLVFKSAKHSYRSPLVDKITLNERNNPKSMDEGERTKTHCVINYNKDTTNDIDEVLLIMERSRDGLSAAQFISYLKQMIIYYERTKKKNLSHTINYQIVAKDNFEAELEKLKRVKIATLHVSKRILGSESLNYSNKIVNVQDYLVMNVKAQKGKTIKEITKDFLLKFISDSQEINKLRIEGTNNDDNDVVLNTDLLAKREYITVEVDEDTGEVNSSSCFPELEALIP